MGFRLQQKSMTLSDFERRRNGRLVSAVLTSFYNFLPSETQINTLLDLATHENLLHRITYKNIYVNPEDEIWIKIRENDKVFLPQDCQKNFLTNWIKNRYKEKLNDVL